MPALELDDGSHLVESLAIVDYLEDKFPQQTLYSGSPEDRAKAHPTPQHGGHGPARPVCPSGTKFARQRGLLCAKQRLCHQHR